MSDYICDDCGETYFTTDTYHDHYAWCKPKEEGEEE